jgi:hypothetical protein
VRRKLGVIATNKRFGRQRSECCGKLPKRHTRGEGSRLRVLKVVAHGNSPARAEYEIGWAAAAPMREQDEAAGRSLTEARSTVSFRTVAGDEAVRVGAARAGSPICA